MQILQEQTICSCARSISPIPGQAPFSSIPGLQGISPIPGQKKAPIESLTEAVLTILVDD